MKKHAMLDDYRGLAVYRKLDYCPADQVEESVSKRLEYAYDNWTVAKAVGDTQDAEALTQRFPHSLLAQGGDFVFKMGPEPHQQFGAAESSFS